jgi:hypothetical protein
MEGKVYRIGAWAGGWGVSDETGRQQAVEPLRAQADAVAHAKELARRFGSGAQILVYGENGNLVSEFFYQRDERMALEDDDASRSVAASRPATAKRG